MKSLSVSVLTSLLSLFLWLLGGQPDTCRAQMRLTTTGRSSAAGKESVPLLKLPLARKVDSVLHHLRAYPRASRREQRRYARELATHFAPSGYITVHQPGQPAVRLAVADFLELFGQRRSATFRFGGAEVVYYGELLDNASGERLTGPAHAPAKQPNWLTPVTTYRNAKVFTGNKPRSATITTVMVPLQGPPPTTDYWQLFNLNLIMTEPVADR